MTSSTRTPGSEVASADHTVHTTDRLKALRRLMTSKDLNLQAYVVPSEDAHQSEYIASCDARRAYISGFTGSAGCAVIDLAKASMFTDGRYFLQASQQMDANWNLMKLGMPGVPNWQDFLVKKLPSGSRIGIDPTLIAAPEAAKLVESLKAADNTLVPVKDNLVDQIWSNRPAAPSAPVFALDKQFAGVAFMDKIAELRRFLTERDAYGFLVSALDEVAWLFNLRGADISFNPVFFAYALVTQNEIVLYLDQSKLGSSVRSHLGDQVTLKPYQAVFTDLREAVATMDAQQQKLVSGLGVSWSLVETVGEDRIETVLSPIMSSKAIKNSTELEGMRQSHIRDAAALVSYFAWLEDQLLFQGQDGKISESAGADQLEKFRREQPHCVGPSFDTISSTGANGAIIHYKPEHGVDSNINLRELYLCDSGGQYYDGTTDVTRTLHFGTPTSWQRECFTRVLQGHIALDTAVFPRGTTGYLLDPLARRPLWSVGLDYRHGTGHGVGSFLNVHEGPHGIGTRALYNSTPLQPGMTVTNEPGYYEDGEFGIRIENVLLITEAEAPNNFGNIGYLKFEHVTLAPMQRKMIQVSLLSDSEIKWINDYHQECLNKVGPLLKDNKLAYDWLERETAPL